VEIAAAGPQAKLSSNRAVMGAPVREGAPHRAALRACSGCSGDYEDPERTGTCDGPDEEDGEAENEQQSAARDKFPVREE